MQDLLEILARVTRTDANLLISGESGTGKEVVARAIHGHSRRRERRFQVIDCTAIPEALFESVLFGHAKGSFTGAIQDQEGLLSLCDRGTAFFDEVGELPFTSQAKLLRAVQEQAFTPVGKSHMVQVDTRFICATNRDLEAEVLAGNFRRDLYYRLGVIHLELPPLRDRGDDVLLLAGHFLSELCPPDRTITGFSEQVFDAFRRYTWPGNVRELRNVVERAIALARSETVQLGGPAQTTPRGSDFVPPPSSLTEISREEALDAADYQYLKSLLEKHGGNIAQAARQAGLSRQGLHKILTKHGIQAADFRT
jgi:transcriptional regulator with GAF, ATPase, and Fis domain